MDRSLRATENFFDSLDILSAMPEGHQDAVRHEVTRLLVDWDSGKREALDHLTPLVGLSVEETAEVLGISVATIGREQRFAEAWLHKEISRKEPSNEKSKGGAI